MPLIVLAARRGSGQLFWVPRPTRKVEIQVLAVADLGRPAAELPPHRDHDAAAGPDAGGAARHRGRDRSGGRAASAERAVGQAMLVAWLWSRWRSRVLLARLPADLPAPQPAHVRAGGRARCWRCGLVRPAGCRGLLAVARVVVLVALRALQLVASYGVSPEPWQQATAYVLARARPGDCIAFYPVDAPHGVPVLRRHAARPRSRAPRSILPVRPGRRCAPTSRTTPRCRRPRSPAGARLPAACGSSPATRASPTARPRRGPTGPGTSKLRGRLERAFGRAPVKQFGYASPIHVQLLPRRRG